MRGVAKWSPWVCGSLSQHHIRNCVVEEEDSWKLFRDRHVRGLRGVMMKSGYGQEVDSFSASG